MRGLSEDLREAEARKVNRKEKAKNRKPWKNTAKGKREKDQAYAIKSVSSYVLLSKEIYYSSLSFHNHALSCRWI